MPAVNDVVLHLISVDYVDITRQVEPPESVTEIVFPSFNFGGKCLPVMVRIVSPFGFNPEFGVTLVTVSGTEVWVSESNGIAPRLSVTTGVHEPVTGAGVTVHTISVDDLLVTSQGTFEKVTD